MMNKIIAVLWLLLFNSNGIAQQIQFRAWVDSSSNYSNPIVFPANAVADDFGPRRTGDNWHGGVDYNSTRDDGNNDKWDLIFNKNNSPYLVIFRLKS